MQFSEVSILTPSLLYVQSDDAAKKKKHKRITRADIPAVALDPQIRAFGRHIARNLKRKRPVRIPAMRGSELGHFLRSLELTLARH